MRRNLVVPCLLPGLVLVAWRDLVADTSPAATQPDGRSRRAALLVLPLATTQPDGEPNWFGEAVSCLLEDRLNRAGLMLHVEGELYNALVGNRPARALSDLSPALDLAGRLHTTTVVFGRYVRADGQFVVSVSVADVATRRIIETRRIAVPMDQPSQAVAPIGEFVAGLIHSGPPGPDRPGLTDEQQAILRRWGGISEDAFDAYGRGVAAAADAERVRWFTRSIRLDPNNQLAYEARGHAHRRAGDLDAAMHDYDNLVELDPRWPQAVNHRVNVHALRGDLDMWYLDSDRAVRLDPDYPMSYANRAAALASKGHFAAALDDCNTALRLDPNYIAARSTRAWVHFHLQDYDSAWDDVRVIRRLNPDAQVPILDRLQETTGRER